MESDRQTFVQQSLRAAASTLVGTRSLMQGSQGSSEPAGELISRMKWMNDPATFQGVGGTLTVRSKPKTDFWRKTFYGYITDNGHFFPLR